MKSRPPVPSEKHHLCVRFLFPTFPVTRSVSLSDTFPGLRPLSLDADPVSLFQRHLSLLCPVRPPPLPLVDLVCYRRSSLGRVEVNTNFRYGGPRDVSPVVPTPDPPVRHQTPSSVHCRSTVVVLPCLGPPIDLPRQLPTTTHVPKTSKSLLVTYRRPCHPKISVAQLSDTVISSSDRHSDVVRSRTPT